MLTCEKTSEINSNPINIPFESGKKSWICSFLIRSDNITVLVKKASPKAEAVHNSQ